MHPLMKYFQYLHLPLPLQQVSQQFAGVALWVDENLAEGSEKTVALRKLLEAKDAAVRAALPPEEIVKR